MCKSHLPISNVEQFMSLKIGGITPAFECAANYGALFYRRIRSGSGQFVRSTFFEGFGIVADMEKMISRR